MTRRAPSSPPEIDGFEFMSIIGSGGFSDVFLYQQQRPARQVAVKVLLDEFVGAAFHEAFDAEADLMAQLSTHPSIVTTYESSLTKDGRPYLAMEFCPRPSLAVRYRRERFVVPDVLRIGIQIAGAVESAHRAGVVHRDIKPANILVNEADRPVLADFGISSTIGAGGLPEGVSVPWSPPESFAPSPTSGVCTDVWALGATVYTLLARRSPFEVPGGANAHPALISRIRDVVLVPTGRPDVPTSLEHVLATSMEKAQESRYPSALKFAQALQGVQTELSLAVTPIDLLGEFVHGDGLHVKSAATIQVPRPTAPAGASCAPGMVGELIVPGRGSIGARHERPSWLWPALCGLLVSLIALGAMLRVVHLRAQSVAPVLERSAFWAVGTTERMVGIKFQGECVGRSANPSD